MVNANWTRIPDKLKKVDPLLGPFYVAAIGVSLTGAVQSASGEHGWIGWHWAPTLGAFAAVEFGGVILSRHADRRRQIGEKAAWARALSAAIATAAVVANAYGHRHSTAQAIFFAGFSLVGYLIYLISASAAYRDALRERGELPPPPPAFGLWNWIRHPRLTLAARRLDRGEEDRVTAAYRKVREEQARLAAEKRDHAAQAVAQKLAYEALEKAHGTDRAKLMTGVVDFVEVVQMVRTAALADRPQLVQFLADQATISGSPRSGPDHLELDQSPVDHTVQLDQELWTTPDQMDRTAVDQGGPAGQSPDHGADHGPVQPSDRERSTHADQADHVAQSSSAARSSKAVQAGPAAQAMTVQAVRTTTWSTLSADEKAVRMDQAVRAVQGGMTDRAAAEKFDVPRTTLKRRVDAAAEEPPVIEGQALDISAEFLPEALGAQLHPIKKVNGFAHNGASPE